MWRWIHCSIHSCFCILRRVQAITKSFGPPKKVVYILICLVNLHLHQVNSGESALVGESRWIRVNLNLNLNQGESRWIREFTLMQISGIYSESGNSHQPKLHHLSLWQQRSDPHGFANGLDFFAERFILRCGWISKECINLHAQKLSKTL